MSFVTYCILSTEISPKLYQFVKVFTFQFIILIYEYIITATTILPMQFSQQSQYSIIWRSSYILILLLVSLPPISDKLLLLCGILWMQLIMGDITILSVFRFFSKSSKSNFNWDKVSHFARKMNVNNGNSKHPVILLTGMCHYKDGHPK